jgi:hypothetical protein
LNSPRYFIKRLRLLVWRLELPDGRLAAVGAAVRKRPIDLKSEIEQD